MNYLQNLYESVERQTEICYSHFIVALNRIENESFGSWALKTQMDAKQRPIWTTSNERKTKDMHGSVKWENEKEQPNKQTCIAEREKRIKRERNRRNKSRRSGWMTYTNETKTGQMIEKKWKAKENVYKHTPFELTEGANTKKAKNTSKHVIILIIEWRNITFGCLKRSNCFTELRKISVTASFRFGLWSFSAQRFSNRNIEHSCNEWSGRKCQIVRAKAQARQKEFHLSIRHWFVEKGDKENCWLLRMAPHARTLERLCIHYPACFVSFSYGHERFVLHAILVPFPIFNEFCGSPNQGVFCVQPSCCIVVCDLFTAQFNTCRKTNYSMRFA